eukprot:118626-Rhodomonas_salina.5
MTKRECRRTRAKERVRYLLVVGGVPVGVEEHQPAGSDEVQPATPRLAAQPAPIIATHISNITLTPTSKCGLHNIVPRSVRCRVCGIGSRCSGWAGVRGESTDRKANWLRVGSLNSSTSF